jgi:hypothetical protein
MRWFRTVALIAAAHVIASAPAAAQDPPPPIGPFVVDLRGNFPRFNNEQQLADSRGLDVSELPRQGFGFDAGLHVYLPKWKFLKIGLGGHFMAARAHSSPPEDSGAGLRAVTERFTTISPQLSFNFGDGDGWSYISGGIGAAQWSVVPDGDEPGPPDTERLRTINYGGGARWFAKRHLAFTVDARFYQIDPGSPSLGRIGSPRTTMFVVGAGVSLK